MLCSGSRKMQISSMAIVLLSLNVTLFAPLVVTHFALCYGNLCGTSYIHIRARIIQYPRQILETIELLIIKCQSENFISRRPETCPVFPQQVCYERQSLCNLLDNLCLRHNKTILNAFCRLRKRHHFGILGLPKFVRFLMRSRRVVPTNI